jgi:hypothetical protein
MSAIVKIALGTLGAAAVVYWMVKEARRINQEIEQLRAAPAVDPAAREALPTLRRDPKTGVWRRENGA